MSFVMLLLLPRKSSDSKLAVVRQKCPAGFFVVFGTCNLGPWDQAPYVAMSGPSVVIAITTYCIHALAIEVTINSDGQVKQAEDRMTKK